MESDDLGDLYQEIILDHSRDPHNQQELDRPDICGEAVNPFCGDETRVQIEMEGGRAKMVGGSAKGCAISQATRSLMTENLAGKTVEDIEDLIGLFQALLNGQDLSEEDLERLGDLTVLAGVRQFPVRIKCALLPWMALEDGVADYLRAAS